MTRVARLADIRFIVLSKIHFRIETIRSFYFEPLFFVFEEKSLRFFIFLVNTRTPGSRQILDAVGPPRRKTPIATSDTQKYDQSYEFLFSTVSGYPVL